MAEIVNNKEMIPFEHYAELYRTKSPEEITARTQTPFDKEKSAFLFTLMGSTYEIGYPDFTVRYVSGVGDYLTGYLAAQILALRFLTGANVIPPSGDFKSYRDMPWGEVYFRNFNGRCINRLAFTFNGRGDTVAQKMHILGGKPYNKGDIGWEFEFIPGLTVKFAIWNADDEFPPSAQILFSDNFPYAFSAEDMAFVGDIFIKIISEIK